ncbi:flagellar basal body-associated FliL family protein [Falsiroseomonas sp. HW251]|uniref:flagellar basal body-associated FliL family protein n=1 Tax=Falsiroseomonas sp. HW251 TaxID=3390998 RepID=UPI003D319558
MSAEEAKPEGGETPATKKGGRKKLMLLALPVVVAAIGAGLWFSGVLKPLLGGDHAQETAEAATPPAPQPAFVDLPDIVSNLNAPGRRASFVRVKAKLEVSRQEDVATVQAAMPRLIDLFSTYLREVRPEELRGSAGSHRLREELIARASLAAAPARVTDVLFVEILVQ